VSDVIGAFPLARMGERLARVASGEDVDGFQLAPGDGGQVAEVEDRAEVAMDQRVQVVLVLGDPRQLTAVDGVRGEVEPAYPGAERTVPHAETLLTSAEP
jgi:hypothetical protein